MKLISAQNSAVEEWQKATRPSRTYAICEVYRVWDNIDNAHCRAMRRLRPLSLLHRVFLAAIL